MPPRDRLLERMKAQPARKGGVFLHVRHRMDETFEELGEWLQTHTWRQAVQAFVEAGIARTDGKPLTPGALATVWFRLNEERRLGKARGTRTRRPKSAPQRVAETDAPTLPVQREGPVAASAAVPGPVQDEDEPRRKLRMVTMKGAAGGKESGSGE